MELTQFFIVIGIFIALMFVYKFADKFVKKLTPKTIKTVNWIGFSVAVAGGIIWYVYPSGIIMIVTVLGVVTYFLFYGYDKPEESAGDGEDPVVRGR